MTDQMERQVLISIHPEFIQAIKDGYKTIEIRKRVPRLDPPYKCYMYCTRPRERVIEWVHDGDEIYGEIYHGKAFPVTTTISDYYGRWIGGKVGLVVGEFVCDGIIAYGLGSKSVAEMAEKGCVTPKSIHEYAGNRDYLLGMVIGDTEFYKEPMPLEAFGLKRPPQSWQYVMPPEGRFA